MDLVLFFALVIFSRYSPFLFAFDVHDAAICYLIRLFSLFRVFCSIYFLMCVLWGCNFKNEGGQASFAVFLKVLCYAQDPSRFSFPCFDSWCHFVSMLERNPHDYLCLFHLQ